MGTFRHKSHSIVGLLSLVAAGAALQPSSASAQTHGDPMRGKEIYSDRCLNCHEYPSEFGLTAADLVPDPNARQAGPSLTGLIGRKAGSLPSYPYSDQMKESGVTWTEETLRSFVPSPRTFIKYSNMMFSGIKDESQVEDVVAYLIEATKAAE